MAVPTRTEAVLLLLGRSPSPRLLRHVTAVAEIASFLCHHAERRGVALDRPLVEAAALLHDIDKVLPRDDPLLELGHGHAGAHWLTEQGHAELARAVAGHPVMRLSDADSEAWLTSAPLEERIVAYADKRAAGRLCSLDDRFARWLRRHPDYADAVLQARDRARRLETDVCALAGVEPHEVERLRWVDEAIARITAGPRDTGDRGGIQEVASP